jgi:F420-non-reducing hydrogenase small subunit
MSKPKVAFYWCASCGGCEEAVVDLNEDVVKVTQAVDIVFWPVALDTKYSDVEKMADGEITVSFINGAVRLDEQEEISRLLRRKSQIVIAFGSCAHTGGIPALGNLSSREELLDRAFFDVPTVVNPLRLLPQTSTRVEGKTLTLPGFHGSVKQLDEVIDVDYYLPGCPPQPDTIRDALGALLSGKLPPKGTVLSPTKSLCSTCSRNETKPEEIAIGAFRRVHEVTVPGNECFLAHGVFCAGIGTRSGCGEKCMSANMPCRGCYGACDGVEDQGAALLSALGGLMRTRDEAQLQSIAASFDDPVGTLYRFSLASSLAHRGKIIR